MAKPKQWTSCQESILNGSKNIQKWIEKVDVMNTNYLTPPTVKC